MMEVGDESLDRDDDERAPGAGTKSKEWVGLAHTNGKWKERIPY